MSAIVSTLLSTQDPALAIVLGGASVLGGAFWVALLLMRDEYLGPPQWVTAATAAADTTSRRLAPPAPPGRRIARSERACACRPACAAAAPPRVRRCALHEPHKV
jgi:hypothetical protein